MESDSNSRQLLDLPDEILISIYGFLDLRTILQALPVCRRFYGLAEPFLYHTIKVLNGRQGSALSTSFAARPRRATWVRSFLVSTKLGDDHGLAGLPPFIAQMASLQDLRLETPDCNKKDPAERVGWVSLQDRYERVFEAASALIPRGTARLLPSLKTCTIHFVDEDKAIYSMTRYSMLFLHPSLRSLTISCASTDLPEALWKSFEGDPLLVKSTGLEHLHLEECDMHPATLSILLSFPRELKSLKISEAIRYDWTFSEQSSRMHGDVCPASFTDAIAEHCAESLESLSLSLGHFRRRGQHINQHGQNLNLLRFEHLKHLELDLRSVNLVRTRPTCDHATWRRLPPSLETLKVFSIPLGQRTPFRALGKAYFPFDVCLVREKAKHGVPNLRRIICSYEYECQDDQPTLIVPDDEQRVEAVSEVSLAKECLLKDCSDLRPVYRKAGVQLEIEMAILPTGFIPPYLYPENQPTTSTLWMS
jgi:F-box-like